MKSIILALTLSLVSANAFAGSKHCEGANNDPTSKGMELNADLSQNFLKVAEGDYAGSYPMSNPETTVNGKDGKTYLVYDLGGEEGCSEVLVDSNLLKAKGKGWIKFRCRGEGFQDTKFFCTP